MSHRALGPQFESVRLGDVDWAEYGEDEDLQPSDEHTISRLASRYSAGHEVDPISVRRNPENSVFPYALDDGWHRIQAAQRAGRTHLPAEVKTP